MVSHVLLRHVAILNIQSVMFVLANFGSRRLGGYLRADNYLH